MLASILILVVAFAVDFTLSCIVLPAKPSEGLEWLPGRLTLGLLLAGAGFSVE